MFTFFSVPLTDSNCICEATLYEELQLFYEGYITLLFSKTKFWGHVQMDQNCFGDPTNKTFFLPERLLSGFCQALEYQQKNCHSQ